MVGRDFLGALVADVRNQGDATGWPAATLPRHEEARLRRELLRSLDRLTGSPAATNVVPFRPRAPAAGAAPPPTGRAPRG